MWAQKSTSPKPVKRGNERKHKACPAQPEAGPFESRQSDMPA